MGLRRSPIFPDLYYVRTICQLQHLPRRRKVPGQLFWIYTGTGDPYDDPLSDVGWTRTAKVKELTPGELTAESYDDSYIDDDAPDWDATAQGVKSAGQTSVTLAWKPGESGQRIWLTGL